MTIKTTALIEAENVAATAASDLQNALLVVAEAKKADNEAKRAAWQEVQNIRVAKEIAETKEFWESNFEGVAGTVDSYIAVSHSYSGGAELTLGEWTTTMGSLSLSDESRKDLIRLLGGTV